MSIARATLALALTGALCACDPMYGVWRSALLPTPPDFPCVAEAVKATPGIKTAEQTPRGESRDIVTGRVTTTDSIVYRGEKDSGVMGALQVVTEKDNITLSNSLWQIGHPPPQSAVDASRPVMRSMETELARRCGMTSLPGQIREICTGVTCGPLP